MYRSRVVFTIVALAVASAAAATIRWQSWTPTNACLLCGRPESAAMRTPESVDPLFGAGGGAASYAHNSAGAFNPGPMAPAQLSAGSSASSSSSQTGAASKGWQPWGNASGSTRFASSGASGPSAPLGGLWRLMSLSRPAHSGGASAVVRESVPKIKEAKPPKAPRPAKTPAPGSHSGTPAAPGTSAAPGASVTSDAPIASGAASTDPFHEHEAPPPDPFRGPGGFDPGTPGGSHPSVGSGGPGKVSAAPEPGSILLFGTGLLGILGVMRQRRLL